MGGIVNLSEWGIRYIGEKGDVIQERDDNPIPPVITAIKLQSGARNP